MSHYELRPTVETLEQQVADYSARLFEFIDKNWLPFDWFSQPDHVAFKCVDASHFEDTMDTLMPQAAGDIAYINLDGRRLGSLELVYPLQVHRFGTVEWLEIMEPRPEKVGQDVVGVDHMEFYMPNFTAAEAVLRQAGVVYKLQKNKNHDWLAIVINEQGQEVKLTSSKLADVAATETKTDPSHRLWVKDGRNDEDL